MYQYKLNAVDKIYQRCEKQLNAMCRKLVHQNKCGNRYDANTITQEARIKFYEAFAEYYDEDQQYLRFLFITIKNQIRNFQNKDNKRDSLFIPPPPPAVTKDGASNDPYLQGLAELKDPKSEEDIEPTYLENISKEFTVDNLVNKLNCELDKSIILCIVSGKSLKETSRSTGLKLDEIECRLEGEILDTIQLLRIE